MCASISPLRSNTSGIGSESGSHHTMHEKGGSRTQPICQCDNVDTSLALQKNGNKTNCNCMIMPNKHAVFLRAFVFVRQKTKQKTNCKKHVLAPFPGMYVYQQRSIPLYSMHRFTVPGILGHIASSPNPSAHGINTNSSSSDNAMLLAETTSVLSNNRSDPVLGQSYT